MNNFSLLILAVVALFLGGYIYLELKDAPGTIERKEKAWRLVEIKSDDVKSISVKSPAGKFRFGRNAKNEWDITEPIKFPAHQNRVETILTELSLARIVSQIDDQALENKEESIKTFQLNEPAFTLTVNMEQKNYELSLGRKTAIEGSQYAIFKEDKKQRIVVIPDNFEPLLGFSLDEWRQQRVFDINPEDISKVYAKTSQEESEMVKVGENWELKKPLQTATDPDRTRTYLASLLNVEAVKFISDSSGDLVKYGLNTPLTVVEIQTGKGPVQLKTGLPVEENGATVFAQVSGRDTIFSLEKSWVDRIANLLDDVRDRHLLDDIKATVEKIEIIRGKEEMVFTKETGSKDWVLDGAGSGKVKQSKINQFLTQWVNVEAVDFHGSVEASKEKFGLDKPSTSIVFTLKVPGQEATPEGVPPAESITREIRIDLGKADEQVIYAASSMKDFVVTIRAEEIRDISSKGYDWLDEKLPLPALEELKTIELKSKSSIYRFDRESEQVWKHGDQTVAQDALDKAIRPILDLDAVRWAGPFLAKDFKAPHVLELTTMEGVSMFLKFGKAMSDKTVVAHIDEDPYTFLVSELELDAIKKIKIP